MNIRSALDEIIAMESALVITDPINATIKRAYNYFPDRKSAMPDTPCWTNAWTLNRIESGFQDNRRQFYTVNAQLFVNDADLSRAADIATGFHVALVGAAHVNSTLNGQATDMTLRGGEPTLVLLEWAGQAYVGLNLYFDVELFD